MNRTFSVLWFEDERLWFNTAKRRVDSIIEEHCLIPNIIRKAGGDFEVSEICSNMYDLMLIDYKLTSGDTGERIISQIRQHNILTDTLFYSSEEEAMINAIHKVSPPIDGIYYTKRDITIFPEKVKRLIDKIVKRSEDLVNLRGFVLDDSCDFEVRVKELLNVAWGKFTEDQKCVLEDAVCRHIDDPSQRYARTKRHVTEEKPFYPMVVNDKHFWSHSDRLYLLTKVIQILKDSYGFVPKTEHIKFKTNYEQDISCYRNAFGHKKKNDTHIEISGNLIPIDATLHQKMRSTLTHYDKLIYELESYFDQNI